MSENRAYEHFIDEIIATEVREGKHGGQVRTRFPPEPNGHLHIGHAKAVMLNFSMAQKYGGVCNLRFDDTNPVKERAEFVDAILEIINWLGYRWDKLLYASDFFEQLYQYAVTIIKAGKAYVDDLSPQEIREYRGTLTAPGRNSPYRDRSPEENLRLFEQMRAGKYEAGTRVLRAKIDMASPNMNMRDPTLYRILDASHQRTGDAWCIYPMYDFQHPLQDAIEGITHSLCSQEYEAHRPLYDWVVQAAGFTENAPRQIEFARLNITGVIMSKRYLRQLVEDGYVNGWDDPRMPTLIGMRRRGYPARAILDFIRRAGVAKADSVVDFAFLEHCIREALAPDQPRMMAVINPIRVVLTNWPEDRVEMLEIENHPERPELGTRQVPFGRELLIEAEDFMENPPGKFFRLRPGGEVRLKSAYIIRCDHVLRDDHGQITQLCCTVDMDSKSGMPGASRKVKGTLHWVSCAGAKPAEFRLYEPLLLRENEALSADDSGQPDADGPVVTDFINLLNPDSLTVTTGVIEQALAQSHPGDVYQFLRMGYFCCDPDSTPELTVFNRTVGLKDSWAKLNK